MGPPMPPTSPESRPTSPIGLIRPISPIRPIAPTSFTLHFSLFTQLYVGRFGFFLKNALRIMSSTFAAAPAA